MKQVDIQLLVNNFANMKVGVIGDLILDRYIWGDATRISPEAPVPIVHVKRRNIALGGAANVINNICHLGGQCHCYGVIGNDREGDSLINLLVEIGCTTDGVVRDVERCTTVKTRVLAGNQQIVRIDEEQSDALSDIVRYEFVKKVKHDISNGVINGLIFEDYNKGVLNKQMVQELVDFANEYGVLTAMDPHPGNKMDIKGLTFMTPNRSESFALAGVFHTDGILPVAKDSALMEVGRILMERWAPKMLITTLGPHGMAMFRFGHEVFHIPTEAQKVFDVSGAGDTVIGTLMLALLAGCTGEQAAEVANHAAGVVVGFVGTVPIEKELLIASFK
ncbi:MAG: bifunctional heptose 7-phosphate kinase/heptose 1-phosphate adenyltransferase [Lentisphaeria bacterium]